MKLRLPSILQFRKVSPKPAAPAAANGGNSGGNGGGVVQKNRRAPYIDDMGQRRWEAAETNRLNAVHWAAASDNTINADLMSRLAILRRRCHLEVARNPFVEGVIQTYVTDICGDHGPKLQVRSDDEEYNSALEDIFAEWSVMPDINGQLALVDFLRLNLRSLFTNGDFINQKVTAPPTIGAGRGAGGGEGGGVGSGGRSGVSLRLLAIDSRRLDGTVFGQPDTGGIVLGVERDTYGRPQRYYINDGSDWSALGFGAADPIEARYILHGFDIIEPGQVRGVPLLACCLESQASLRDYDAQMLESARTAADHSAFLYNETPDAAELQMGSKVDIETGQLTTLPPGWKALFGPATAPGTQYIEYRASRLADLGRPLNMPLMMVLLNSGDHNYSSARFDGQIYQRACGNRQAWFERVMLNSCVADVAAEADLGGLLPKRPAKVTFEWTWPKQPHVDPAKEANAEATRMSSHTLTLASACASHGDDWEEIERQIDREKRIQNTKAVEQLVALQEQIDKANENHPDLKLHWSHVVAIGGATTAPGAFLQGASPPPQPVADPNAPDAADAQDAADTAAGGKAKQPNRMAPHLSGNGVHR